jgi:hypothetical protein
MGELFESVLLGSHWSFVTSSIGDQFSLQLLSPPWRSGDEADSFNPLITWLVPWQPAPMMRLSWPTRNGLSRKKMPLSSRKLGRS